MKVQITFRHMEHTEALDSLIKEKSEKFNKWFGGKADIHWTCWVEDKTSHCSEVKIHSGQKDYFAKASTEVMYKTIDQVIQKIQNQMQ
jgi:putative sigma-54 modulation protein